MLLVLLMLLRREEIYGFELWLGFYAEDPLNVVDGFKAK